jgi:hypothetical protein
MNDTAFIQQLLADLRAYLDERIITSENIGEIRRSLFFPWDSPWNGMVRDETAQREVRAVADGEQTA